jgi:hypothetical protein
VLNNDGAGARQGGVGLAALAPRSRGRGAGAAPPPASSAGPQRDGAGALALPRAQAPSRTSRRSSSSLAPRSRPPWTPMRLASWRGSCTPARGSSRVRRRAARHGAVRGAAHRGCGAARPQQPRVSMPAACDCHAALAAGRPFTRCPRGPHRTLPLPLVLPPRPGERRHRPPRAAGPPPVVQPRRAAGARGPGGALLGGVARRAARHGRGGARSEGHMQGPPPPQPLLQARARGGPRGRRARGRRRRGRAGGSRLL